MTIANPCVSTAFASSFRDPYWTRSRLLGDHNPITYDAQELQTATLNFFVNGIINYARAYLREWCVQHDLIVRRPRGAPRVPALWSTMLAHITGLSWLNKQDISELPELVQQQIAVERAAFLFDDADTGQALDGDWRKGHVEAVVRFHRRILDALQAWRHADGIANDVDLSALDVPGEHEERTRGAASASADSDTAAVDAPESEAAEDEEADEDNEAEDVLLEAEETGAGAAAAVGAPAAAVAPVQSSRLVARRFRPRGCPVPRQRAMAPQKTLSVRFATFDDDCFKGHLHGLVKQRGGVVLGLLDDVFRRGGIHKSRQLGAVVKTDGHALIIHFLAPAKDPHPRATRGGGLKETKGKVVSGKIRTRRKKAPLAVKVAATSKASAKSNGAASARARPKRSRKKMESDDDESSASEEDDVEDDPPRKAAPVSSLCYPCACHSPTLTPPLLPTPPHPPAACNEGCSSTQAAWCVPVWPRGPRRDGYVRVRGRLPVPQRSGRLVPPAVPGTPCCAHGRLVVQRLRRCKTWARCFCSTTGYATCLSCCQETKCYSQCCTRTSRGFCTGCSGLATQCAPPWAPPCAPPCAPSCANNASRETRCC